MMSEMDDGLIQAARNCKKLFLDYDGTLVPITARPDEAMPDDELLNLLDKLDKRFNIFIITGRSAHDIQHFIDSRYEIIAMHGAQIIHKGYDPEYINGYEKFKKVCDDKYYELKYLEKEFPGLMVINKSGGLQFHYYYMDKERLHDLVKIIIENVPPDMEVYYGKFVIEYRIKGINKGKAILNLIEPSEIILFAGDDATDEEAFDILRNHITIKIGMGETKARYRMKDYKEFRSFLWSLIS